MQVLSWKVCNLIVLELMFWIRRLCALAFSWGMCLVWFAIASIRLSSESPLLRMVNMSTARTGEKTLTDRARPLASTPNNKK